MVRIDRQVGSIEIGVTALFERVLTNVLVGNNPMLGGDAWRISIQPKTSSVQIRFPRLANRAFEVQWTTHLQDTESWVALDQPAHRPFFSSTNGQPMIEDLTIGPSAKFYRVRIHEP
jgi:hypothetical protein